MHRNSHILPAQTYFEGCWNQESCQMPTPSHPTLPPSWHHCKAMNHRCKKGLPHIHAWRHTPRTHRWDCGTFTAPRCPIKMLRGQKGGIVVLPLSISVKAMKVVSWRPVSYYIVQRVSATSRPGFLLFFISVSCFLVGCTNTWLGLHTQTTLFKHQNTRLNPAKHKSCGLKYMHTDCHCCLPQWRRGLCCYT